jgi:hypothetical protein
MKGRDGASDTFDGYDPIAQRQAKDVILDSCNKALFKHLLNAVIAAADFGKNKSVFRTTRTYLGSTVLCVPFFL